MNFLEIIKSQIDDHRNYRGSSSRVSVDYRSLHELLDHFESVDAQFRALHDERDTRQNLRNAITAMFHEKDRNSEKVLILIMDTLTLLIEEKLKQNAMNRMRFTHRGNKA